MHAILQWKCNLIINPPLAPQTAKLTMKIAIISMLVAAALAAEPCCKACDTSAGFAKYYSIDKLHNMCGECCMKPSDYPKYHLFEPGLKAANGTNTPCDDLSYPTYDSTVTHGFGPIKMTLDLYKPSAAKPVVVSVSAAGQDAPNYQKCFYADPWKQGCKATEVNATIPVPSRSDGLKVCSAPCATDADCPTSLCPGVLAVPKCMLADQSTGLKFCGLACDSSSECSSDEHMVCQKTGSNKGVCGYWA